MPATNNTQSGAAGGSIGGHGGGPEKDGTGEEEVGVTETTPQETEAERKARLALRSEDLANGVEMLIADERRRLDALTKEEQKRKKAEKKAEKRKRAGSDSEVMEIPRPDSGSRPLIRRPVGEGE